MGWHTGAAEHRASMYNVARVCSKGLLDELGAEFGLNHAKCESLTFHPDSVSSAEISATFWKSNVATTNCWFRIPSAIFNIATGNGPFIDGLPIKNGGSFHGYVSHSQMVLFIFKLKMGC